VFIRISRNLPIAIVSTKAISIRLVTLAFIMLAELMIVSLGYDANRPGLIDSGEWYGFLSYAGQIAKMLVAILVFALLGLLPRLPEHFHSLAQAIRTYPFQYFVVLQLIIYALFLWCTSAIFGAEVRIDEISGGMVGAWFVMLFATGVFWLLSFAPLHFWRNLFTSEIKVFLAALVVGIAAWVLAGYAQTLWAPLSDLTFSLSAYLLGQVYPDILVDVDSKRLGVGHFIVNIAPECSGYEGMGLMVDCHADIDWGFIFTSSGCRGFPQPGRLDLLYCSDRRDVDACLPDAFLQQHLTSVNLRESGIDPADDAVDTFHRITCFDHSHLCFIGGLRLVLSLARHPGCTGARGLLAGLSIYAARVQFRTLARRGSRLRAMDIASTRRCRAK
jgi:hypothetical protein